MPSPTSTGMVVGDAGSLRQFEYHGDTGNASWAPRVSYGSTGSFTVRTSALSSALVTSSTGYSTGSADFISPPWARGVMLFVDTSAITSATSGNFTMAVEVQPKDPISGNYVSMSSGGWMTPSSSNAAGANGTTGTVPFLIYPSVVNTTGRTVSAVIPGQWRAVTTFAGSSFSLTWSISGQYEP